MSFTYTGIFVDKNELMAKYPPVHPNIFYHHSTIEFKPKSIESLPLGQEIELKIIGRLTTDKVDALLVDNPLSKNAYPHITLSTAEGVNPFESNTEIQNNMDKVTPLNDNIIGFCGGFDGDKVVYDEKEKLNEYKIIFQKFIKYNG